MNFPSARDHKRETATAGDCSQDAYISGDKSIAGYLQYVCVQVE
jgi:hypothetical protein